MKKLFGIVLAAALLLCMLPTTVFSATVIDEVLLSLPEPIVGQTPPKPTALSDDISVYAYEWYHGGERLSSYDVLESGETYKLKVRITTLKQFSDDVSVKVNNFPANVLQIEYNNTHVVLERTFVMPQLGYTLSFEPGLMSSGTMEPMKGKTSYILPPCTFPAPAGKEFRYWRVDGTNDMYEAGDTIILRADTTLIPSWGDASTRTKISEVVAKSNAESVVKLYGVIKSPEFTVTQGTPAKVMSSLGNLNWQKNVDGNWETQQSGRFTPGQWRMSASVRIDGDDANTYEFGNSVTFVVDGRSWTADKPNNNATYCYVHVTSPTFDIADDPNTKPPQEITSLKLSVSGYKVGAKVSKAQVSSNDPNVLVKIQQFSAFIDSNADGTPEDVASVGEVFEADLLYAVDIIITAKDGYDISKLSLPNVTLNGSTVLGSYNANDDRYEGVGFLPVFEICKISFSAGGGNGTMQSVTVEKGAYTLPQSSFTAPEGKQFKAWSVGGKETAPGSKITVKTDTVLTAVWEDLPAQEVITPDTKPEPTVADPTPGQEIDPTPGQQIDPSSGEEETPGEDDKEAPKPDWLLYGGIGGGALVVMALPILLCVGIGGGVLVVIALLILLFLRKKKKEA